MPITEGFSQSAALAAMVAVWQPFALPEIRSVNLAQQSQTTQLSWMRRFIVHALVALSAQRHTAAAMACVAALPWLGEGMGKGTLWTMHVLPGKGALGTGRGGRRSCGF